MSMTSRKEWDSEAEAEAEGDAKEVKDGREDKDKVKVKDKDKDKVTVDVEDEDEVTVEEQNELKLRAVREICDIVLPRDSDVDLNLSISTGSISTPIGSRAASRSVSRAASAATSLVSLLDLNNTILSPGVSPKPYVCPAESELALHGVAMIINNEWDKAEQLFDKYRYVHVSIDLSVW